jgi:hypothetical protein
VVAIGQLDARLPEALGLRNGREEVNAGHAAGVVAALDLAETEHGQGLDLGQLVVAPGDGRGQRAVAWRRAWGRRSGARGARRRG